MATKMVETVAIAIEDRNESWHLLRVTDPTTGKRYLLMRHSVCVGLSLFESLVKLDDLPLADADIVSAD